MRLLKGFRINDPQIRAVNHHPLRSILVRPLAGQKIGDFLLAVNDFPRIEFVGKDAAYPVLTPLAIPLCPQPSLIEEDRDFCRTVTILDVPLVNLADNRCFFLIDCKVEVVADSFIIPIDNVGDTAFFCVHFLTKFHALRGVRTFFLCQRPEDC